MLGNHKIDMILFPTVPSVDTVPNATDLSFPLGTMNMLSILSGVGTKSPRIFNFLHCFQPIVWILILLSYVVCANIASYIEKNWSQMLFFCSILFNQSNKLVLKSMGRNYAFLMGLWLFMIFFIYYSFHESLLSSILSENPNVVIDSVEDMAEFAIEGKLKQLYVLEGEAGEGYIKERNDIIGSALQPIMEVIIIDEKLEQMWDEYYFPLFASGEYALISDNSFLNYKYVTKLANNSKLYRGQEEIMTLPYFIAFSSNVPVPIKDGIDKM